MKRRETSRADRSPSGPDVDPAQKGDQMAGQRPQEDQGAVIDASDVGRIQGSTPTDRSEGDLGADVQPWAVQDTIESYDLLVELDDRDGETDDAQVAIQEGLTYVPPTDPPTVPSSSLEDASVASGFGESSLDEPYDGDHRSEVLPDAQVGSRVRSAIRADSTTTQYAESVRISVRDRVVVLKGVVADLVDADQLVAVASDVAGVDEVIDALTVRTMG